VLSLRGHGKRGTQARNAINRHALSTWTIRRLHSEKVRVFRVTVCILLLHSFLDVIGTKVVRRQARTLGRRASKQRQVCLEHDIS